jgi:hypothetical protein
MQTLLLTITVIALLMGMMAVGVMLSGKELRGSCGGVGQKFCLCDAQGRPRECERKTDDRPDEADIVPLSALGRAQSSND